MIFNMSVGVAHIAAGAGLLVLCCAFIPVARGLGKEWKCGPIKVVIHHPVVFASGALLYGLGSIAIGILSLIVRFTTGA